MKKGVSRTFKVDVEDNGMQECMFDCSGMMFERSFSISDQLAEYGKGTLYTFYTTFYTFFCRVLPLSTADMPVNHKGTSSGIPTGHRRNLAEFCG